MSVFKQPTVFVVDDEPGVLKAVARSVGSLDCKVQTFSSPLECLNALKETRCAVIVSDVNMPDMDGLELLREARRIQPLVQVVLMTGFASIPLAVKAVQEGAYHFVEKPFDEEGFLPIVQSVLDQSGKSRAGDVGKSLSEAERTVLALVAEGLTNKEIAHRLDRSIRTVENHRHRLTKKLGARSTAELVKVAVELGLA